MNAVQNFNYQNSNVRTVTVDGEPWFVANDVCEILDLGNPRTSLAKLDEDEKGVHIMDTPGGPQEMTVINEPGLYALVLKSRKPEAKAFKRWITHEVIPSIRKTGSYSVQRDPITEIDRFAAMMTQVVPAINERLIAVENATKELDPQKLAEDAAEVVAKRKRELEELRGDLHKLVHMIVRRAKSLPEEDSMAKSWNHPSKVWPPVHRHVGVSRLDAYTHADQFEKAIQFARNTLRLLGEEPPVQLRLVS